MTEKRGLCLISRNYSQERPWKGRPVTLARERAPHPPVLDRIALHAALLNLIRMTSYGELRTYDRQYSPVGNEYRIATEFKMFLLLENVNSFAIIMMSEIHNAYNLILLSSFYLLVDIIVLLS